MAAREWREEAQPGTGIVVPRYVRSDGCVVAFSASYGWQAFWPDGGRMLELGAMMAAGLMMQALDRNLPLRDDAVEQRAVSLAFNPMGELVVLTDRGHVYSLLSDGWHRVQVPPLPLVCGDSDNAG